MDGFLKDMATAKDNEIEELRKQLAEKDNTIEKIRAYALEFKKILSHVDIELGDGKPKEITIIDLSTTPPTPAAVPAPATSNANAFKANIRNVRTSGLSTGASTRPAISSRIRREYSRRDI